jgi:hypothetical protein
MNPDNSVTIIVSHKNLGIENNLITEGRDNGAMLLRWIGADSCPIPEVSIKKLTDLEEEHA